MQSDTWQEITLGSLVEDGKALIQTGPFGSQLHSYDYVPVGVPVVPTEAIGWRKLNSAGIPKISLKKAEDLCRHRLKEGDILFARRGIQATGLSAIVKRQHQDWICGTGAILLRLTTHEVDPVYLSFFLIDETTRKWLRTNSVGAVMPNLNEGMLKRLPLRLPPRKTQERIANILGTLDDKIELNRQMNETLEAMARRLFKSWFVDFDPVHAKAALRREHPRFSNADLSRRALPNMAPEIAELFPDGFEESVLGAIPKWWNVAKLCDHTDATRGLSYKGSGLAETGMVLHNLNSVLEGGGYKFEGLKFYTGEFQSRHRVSAGDVIVANTEQGHDCLLLGYAAIVPDAFSDDGLFSHHLYQLRIRPDSPITADFLCRLLNSPRMHEVVSGYGNGTTVNMLPIDGVQQPHFVVPPRDLLMAYSDLAVNSRSQSEVLIKESRLLETTRDSLLPKLLSGQVTTERK